MPPTTRTMSAGGSFAINPSPLRKEDFGSRLPTPAQCYHGSQEGRRQEILVETLTKLEEASPTAHYHVLALRNLQRWAEEAGKAAREKEKTEGQAARQEEAAAKRKAAALDASGPAPRVEVHVLPGDWGEVTLEMTRRFGTLFASLNMANAYAPGGGYTHGMVAQEENMFRRTDCHFSIRLEDIAEDEEYKVEVTNKLNAKDGRVYLDVEQPRVCIRGPEDRSRGDLGYPWLADEEVFPFYELRAAAVDLRSGEPFSRKETQRRVAAQLDTLAEAGVRHAVLSAFGCGAFRNPAAQVAAVYKEELQKRAGDFDVIAFGIFNAGYGPDNFTPFQQAFADF